MLNKTVAGQARLSDNFKYIYDDAGKKVRYDDPRVVHVWPITTTNTTTRMIGAAFNKRGWRFRFTDTIDSETLKYARKLCSGRECLPCVALTGGTYMDMVNSREKDEISVYYNLNQDGPCQNGGWVVIWDTFSERLKHENAIFMAYPGIGNNFMGQGDVFALELCLSISLGDIFDEAESTLKCLAKDKEEALFVFKRYTDHVIESIPRGIWPLKKALSQWVQKTKKIPLKGRLEDVPKVLLFGGLNVIFIHHPITAFFEEQGIIAKVIDFSEGASWLTSEFITRFGLERGLMSPDEQYSMIGFLSSFWRTRSGIKTVLNALRATVHIWGIDSMIKILRWYIGKTGLLYDEFAPFPRLAREGHVYASTNGFNETSITVGRYICAEKDGIFDGLVNTGSFNCQPAMNAQAILQPLASVNDIPFVSIDSEGPWLSANQERLLETLAVQAKRHRIRKMGKVN